MLSDEENYSDTDSEPCPQNQRRSYHNFLERNRRNVLKFSFSSLKNSVPSFGKNSRYQKHDVRRKYQNTLERKRRCDLKVNFTKLDNSLPSFPDSQVSQPSRNQILKKAIDYIHRTASRLPDCLADIDKYKKENSYLKSQIKALEDAKGLHPLSKSRQASGELEITDSEEDPEDSEEAARMKKRPAACYSTSKNKQSHKKSRWSTSGESEAEDELNVEYHNTSSEESEDEDETSMTYHNSSSGESEDEDENHNTSSSGESEDEGAETSVTNHNTSWSGESEDEDNAKVSYHKSWSGESEDEDKTSVAYNNKRWSEESEDEDKISVAYRNKSWPREAENISITAEDFSLTPINPDIFFLNTASSVAENTDGLKKEEY